MMRCLALARQLRAQDCSITFLCREHAPGSCAPVESGGFPVVRLAHPGRGASEVGHGPYADWLGTSWQEDAAETLAAIASLPRQPDWLVVDHYALDARWEGRLRGAAPRIMVVDDLGNRSHDCDLLVDHNLAEAIDSRYLGKVPPRCRTLIGPAYGLLDPDYARLHGAATVRRPPVRRIFAYFGGGAEAVDICRRMSNAFEALGRTDICLDLVVPALSHEVESPHTWASAHSNVHVHANLPTLAPLMRTADLAVGAGGVTTWERMCVGLPSIVLATAENQMPACLELSRLGLIRFLGPSNEVATEEMQLAIEFALEDVALEEWSSKCLQVSDGRGSLRVFAEMALAMTGGLVIRGVRAEDEGLLLGWANDPTTRRNAFNTKSIEIESHRSWFESRLADKQNCRIFIAELAGARAVGQVRFERDGGAWSIDYSVSPEYRGIGLGKAVLAAAMVAMGKADPGARLRGVVKETNVASQRVFEALGFDRSLGTGQVEYRLDLQATNPGST